MSITISDKTLILTDYIDLLPLVTGTLSAINLVQYSENNSLSSLTLLKNRLKEEGNLSFLKKDILNFIQQNGYPFIILIDMNINSGVGTDHENNKVLKTLLLSYIIIMQSEQYKNISCNIIILTDNKEYCQFKTKHKQPQDLLSILRTNDDRLNNIIHEYTVNSEKFKKNFNILVTDAQQEPTLIKSELILFINMIRAKEKFKNKTASGTPEPVAGPKINAARAADVVLRSGTIFFKNGEEPAVYNEELNLNDKEVYILGNLTSYTRLDVIKKLLNLLKNGFGDEVNFKKGDNLILNIPDESIIDSTTPITLAQLISKELTDYKNIRIKTSASHYQLMQQSKGFSMIQRNVIIY